MVIPFGLQARGGCALSRLLANILPVGGQYSSIGLLYSRAFASAEPHATQGCVWYKHIHVVKLWSISVQVSDVYIRSQVFAGSAAAALYSCKGISTVSQFMSKLMLPLLVEVDS